MFSRFFGSLVKADNDSSFFDGNRNRRSTLNDNHRS